MIYWTVVLPKRISAFPESWIEYFKWGGRVNASEKTALILLSEEGHHVLELAAVSLPEPRGPYFYVQDTDDLGMWVRVPREDGEHLLLLRWDYVLTVDFPAGEIRSVGLSS
jgi:hypothetical protein